MTAKKIRKARRTKKVRKVKKVKKGTVAAGKRKRAIAKAIIREIPGGQIRINKKPLELLPQLRQLFISEPLIIAEKIIPEKLKQISIHVTTKGGGIEAQTEAARLAIARALTDYTKSKELHDAFIAYDRSLLIADTRRKETRKPGISKARKKRQKSYR